MRAGPYLSAAPAAMELAADESVILAYWQLRDGVADGPRPLEAGWSYRVWPPPHCGAAIEQAAAARPGFDGRVRRTAGGL